jgi:hypothetical protein
MGKTNVKINWDTTEPSLSMIDLVLARKKSITMVLISSEAQKYAQKHGLDCVESAPALWGNTNEQPNQYCIGYHNLVKDILPELIIPDIPSIREEIRAMTDNISSMYIAEAGAYLNLYPRHPRVVNEWNGERPEVAVLEGVLFGYAPCCIEYYIDTRYLDKPKHGVYLSSGTFENHVRCLKCCLEENSKNN